MRKKTRKKDDCFTREELGALAVRNMSRVSAGGDFHGGPREVIPEDLCVNIKRDLRNHVMKCNRCRDILLAEVTYFQQYIKALDETDKSEFVTGKLSGWWEKSGKVKVLRLSMPDDPDKKDIAAAASTGRARDETIRLSTESGDLIIKQIRDSKKEIDGLILIGENRFVKNARVIINGESYFSDEEGYIWFEDNMPDLGFDELVMVTPRLGPDD